MSLVRRRGARELSKISVTGCCHEARRFRRNGFESIAHVRCLTDNCLDLKTVIVQLSRVIGNSNGLMLSAGLTFKSVLTISGVRGSVLSERLIHHCGSRPDRSGRKTAMLAPNPGIPSNNKLLSALPREGMALLGPHLLTKVFPQGVALLETGEEFDHVYFPHSGMLSLLMVMREGKAIETGTVGREGVVGAMAGLGLYTSSVRVVVQLPLAVSIISASHFRKAVQNSDAVRDLCIRYNEALLVQARVTAACNALHPIERRFCRWLLQSADRAESDTVQITQDFLSEMLGVRRTSVTEVASSIQKLGAITYSRGVIQIIDRVALEAMACECYATLRVIDGRFVSART